MIMKKIVFLTFCFAFAFNGCKTEEIDQFVQNPRGSGQSIFRFEQDNKIRLVKDNQVVAKLAPDSSLVIEATISDEISNYKPSTFTISLSKLEVGNFVLEEELESEETTQEISQPIIKNVSFKDLNNVVYSINNTPKEHFYDARFKITSINNESNQMEGSFSFTLYGSKVPSSGIQLQSKNESKDGNSTNDVPYIIIRTGYFKYVSIKKN